MSAAPRAKHAEDFVFGETLGHGSFGAVVRATDKETGTEYAIKIIEKALVVRYNKAKYVVTERDILSHCNHPNIVKLFYTFRSATSLRLSLLHHSTPPHSTAVIALNNDDDDDETHRLCDGAVSRGRAALVHRQIRVV